MQPEQILKSELIDILFEGRNKDYGAYDLRKTYNKRLWVAVSSMVLVCLLLFAGTLIAGRRIEPVKPTVIDLVLSSVPDKVEPPKPLPPPPAKVRTHIATEIYTPPIITSEPIPEEDQLKAIEDLQDVQIGKIESAGDKLGDYVAPPVEKGVSGTPQIVAPKQVFETIFTRVEVEARFPGGPDAWKRYLERSLNAQAPTDEGAPIGRYTVTVQFIVDKEGNISDVVAIHAPKNCSTCAAEAVKVIVRGGKWEPAIQNGQRVKYQAIQNITFSVEE